MLREWGRILDNQVDEESKNLEGKWAGVVIFLVSLSVGWVS